MSNQQWNNGQGANGGAPQQPAEDWGQAQPTREWAQPVPAWGQPQPQPSAQDWAQQPTQDWNQAQQPAQEWSQPQQSAPEWGQQQPTPEWGQQQQPGQDWSQPQQSASAWGQAQQPTQDWSQPQQSAPEWGQQQNWQAQQPGQFLPAQPQFHGQPVEPKASPFDFSFQKLSLPGSAGLIFLLGSVAIGVEWLFGFIALLTAGGEFYFVGVAAVLNSLVGGLAGVLFKVLVLRVLIEIGIVGTRLLKKAEEEPEAKAEEMAEEKPEEA